MDANAITINLLTDFISRTRDLLFLFSIMIFDERHWVAINQQWREKHRHYSHMNSFFRRQCISNKTKKYFFFYLSIFAEFADEFPSGSSNIHFQLEFFFLFLAPLFISRVRSFNKEFLLFHRRISQIHSHVYILKLTEWMKMTDHVVIIEWSTYFKRMLNMINKQSTNIVWSMS